MKYSASASARDYDILRASHRTCIDADFAELEEPLSFDALREIISP